MFKVTEITCSPYKMVVHVSHPLCEMYTVNGRRLIIYPDVPLFAPMRTELPITTRKEDYKLYKIITPVAIFTNLTNICRDLWQPIRKNHQIREFVPFLGTSKPRIKHTPHWFTRRSSNIPIVTTLNTEDDRDRLRVDLGFVCDICRPFLRERPDVICIHSNSRYRMH